MGIPLHRWATRPIQPRCPQQQSQEQPQQEPWADATGWAFVVNGLILCFCMSPPRSKRCLGPRVCGPEIIIEAQNRYGNLCVDDSNTCLHHTWPSQFSRSREFFNKNWTDRPRRGKSKLSGVSTATFTCVQILCLAGYHAYYQDLAGGTGVSRFPSSALFACMYDLSC